MWDILKPHKTNNLIIGQLFFSKFAQNVTLIAGGTALGQIVAVAASPILTRQYSPEDFGIYSVYISILSFLLTLGCLQYDSAIPLPADDEEAFSLLVLSVIIAIGMSFIGLSLLYWSRNYLSIFFPGVTIIPYLGVLAISLIGANILRILNFWAIRKKAISSIAKIKLSQGIGQTITQIGLGVFHIGPWGLLVGDAVGRISGTQVLISANDELKKRLTTKYSFKHMLSVAIRYKKFPLMASIAKMLNVTLLQLPPFILAVNYGMQVAGWYAMADRVLGLTLTLISQSIAQVYISEVTQLSKNQTYRIKLLFIKILKTLIILGIPMNILLYLIGQWAFVLVFGEHWAKSGEYLRIMALAFFTSFLASPLGSTLDILERQDLLLIREIIRLFLIVGTLIYAVTNNLSPESALSFLNISIVIGYSIHLFITWFAINHTLLEEKCRDFD